MSVNPQKINHQIIKLNQAYHHDKRKNKINLVLGVYSDDKGQPFILPSVKSAVKSLTLNNFNYLPLSGDPDFLKLSSMMILGPKLYNKLAPLLVRQGVAGGTNGLYLFGLYAKEINNQPELIMGLPTWENHYHIFSKLDFKIHTYPHLASNNSFNINETASLIENHPGSYILFHSGLTHNPTGINPSKEDWKTLFSLIQKYGQTVIFDSAYIGLGESIEKDTEVIRTFVKNQIPVVIIASFSKNMSLYQHRTGILIQINNSFKKQIKSQEIIQSLYRMINSFPPAYGELVVRQVLHNPDSTAQWHLDLKNIIKHLNTRRQLFVKYTGRDFSYLLNHHGLFSLLRLSQTQINALRKKYAVYLLDNGRINWGNMAVSNISYLADAIKKVS